jgi:GT2 family glycosyltransferase
VVNWNGGAGLIQTLGALDEAPGGDPTTEAILIDNASTDASADRAARRFPWLRVIRNAANLGFGAANNVGFSQTRGRYVLVLNPDTRVTRAAVDTLVQFMKSHPQAGACGPKILEADARSVSPWCARRDPRPLDVFFEYAHLYRLFPRHRLFARYTLGDWDHACDREVDALSGACMLVRREVIEQVGGFDEQYFMYGEDLDWCRRMRQAGWQVWFVAAAAIRHWGGRSTRQVGDHGASWSVESIVRYFRKWGSRTDLFKARLVLSMGCLLRSVAWLLVGCFRPGQVRHAFSRSLGYLKNSRLAWTI